MPADRPVWYGWLVGEPKVNSGRAPGPTGDPAPLGGQTRLVQNNFSEDIVAETRRTFDEHREIKERVLQIEHTVYQLFALQQPMAGDLRAMLTVLRILHEIELTGGLMHNVARATRRLYPRDLPPRIRGIIERMGAQASVQTHLAVDAFADGDEAIASALPDMDDVMDDLQKELFRAIFAGFSGESTDEAALQMAVQLAFVGRDYERAADHAVMIGRWVEFMVTGQLPGEVPGDLDLT